MTVDLLRTTLAHPAYANKYKVTVTFPILIHALMGVNQIFGQKYDKINDYQVLAHNVTFPETSLSTPEIWVYGHKLPLRGAIQCDNRITLQVYLDQQHTFKRLCEVWMRGMDVFDSLLGINSYFPNGMGGLTGSALSLIAKIVGFEINIGYMTDIYLEQLAPKDKSKRARYIAKHCYPKRISEISYAGTNSSSIQSITVDFACAYVNSENYGI